MEYVVSALLVLLLVGGFAAFMVLNATNKSGPSADRPHEGPPGIGQDETPLGDTAEHAGEQTEEGTTARDPERGRFERSDPDAAAHVGRPGEGEGRERLAFEGERPASAQLGHRDG
jgi:hypothetical protein